MSIPTIQERKRLMYLRAMTEALQVSGGNVSEAAELLGVARRTWYSWAEKYGTPNLGLGAYDPDEPSGGLLDVGRKREDGGGN